jgi:flagellin-like hook-associated protein FlgL
MAISLTSGMRQNLFSLQQTDKLLQTTQKRLATGLRVQKAVDDPVNYFTAIEHRERATDLATRKDEMSEAIQTVAAANEGVEAITALIASAKSLAQSALSSSGTSIDVLRAQYAEVLSQINSLAADSGYKGVNLLESNSGSVTTYEVKFDEKGDSSLTITGFDANVTGTTLNLVTADTGDWASGGTATGAAATASATAIGAAITALDNATTALRSEAQKLSTNLSTITIRQDFTSNMINTLEDGAANLTNADMNEEGANMLMLQTRQQLGTTSLSMASQAAQSVLRLF